MRRYMARAAMIMTVLLVMVSLSGCTLVFHVTGSDVYEVTNTSLEPNPIKVDISVVGIWPVWPDTLTMVLSGTVNPPGASLILGDDIALANAIEQAIYDQLEDGDFSSVTMEEDGMGLDNEFRVTAVMVIPDWRDLLGTGGASTAIEYDGLALSLLMGEEKYDQLVSGLKEACTMIPEGDVVDLDVSGELANLAKGKLVGDLAISFLLNGSLTVTP